MRLLHTMIAGCLLTGILVLGLGLSGLDLVLL